MNNVFVQCELWCEEILRRVARPCCTCSRHVSSQALEDLMPLGPRAHFEPGATSTFVPGLEIAVGPCPSTSYARNIQPTKCPAMKSEAETCGKLHPLTQAYFMHEAQHSISSWPRYERASRSTSPAHETTRTASSTLLDPTFTNSTSNDFFLSSPDWIENRFKSDMEESLKRSLEDNTPSNIHQVPITTTSSTGRTSCLSSHDSKELFLFHTLSPKPVSLDVDTDGSVQKVLYDSGPHDNINRHSPLLKPSSSISDTCEYCINNK